MSMIRISNNTESRCKETYLNPTVLNEFFLQIKLNVASNETHNAPIF
uniref:Uncharacterized protein n=1 Tax=Rhizophora mucronata TaxID=61149 RepID=A0A2P2MXS1_RHIMU